MRVLGRSILEGFMKRYADARGPTRAWLERTLRASWDTPADVQRDYGPDAVLPNNVAVFNIKGNRYRIVVKIDYQAHVVLVKYAVTHERYDDIDLASL